MSKSMCLFFAGLLLCAGGFNARAEDLATPSPLHGQWSGLLHYGSETRAIGLRFATDDKQSTIAFIDSPELRFHDLGPMHVKTTGNGYQAFLFNFHVTPDNRIVGVWSFDGHDVTFELAPGALPPAAPQAAAARIASPRWTFKTAAAIWASPSVVDHIVYFGSSDSNVYALKASSGAVVWHFATGGAVLGQPAFDRDHVYVLSDDGFLYKLQRKSGALAWKFQTNDGKTPRDMVGSNTSGYDTQTSTPLIEGGTVYIGSADNRLYAVDAESGREKWHFETGGIVRSSPAIANGVVYFGSRDHNVYAVDARTGSLKWKFDTLKEVVSSPLVDRGTLYIGSRSSDLFALDATSGKVKWKSFYWSSWVESSARVRDGVLYIGSSDAQQLFAIDSENGRRIWSFDTGGSPWTTPAVTRTRLFIGTAGVEHYFIAHHGGFFAVDRSTGKEVWRYPMPPIDGSTTSGVASSPATQDGLVFFGGLDGVFYAFSAE